MKNYQIITVSCILMLVLVYMMNFSSSAAIFDDQTVPLKALSMIADRIALYSDEVTTGTGGTVEVDVSSYMDAKVIGWAATCASSTTQEVCSMYEDSTAGKFIVNGGEETEYMVVIWGRRE